MKQLYIDEKDILSTADYEILSSNITKNIDLSFNDSFLISSQTLTLKSKHTIKDFLTNNFNSKNLKYIENNRILIDGKIINTVFTDNSIEITIQPNITSKLNSVLIFESQNTNPVDVLKSIIETNGGIIDNDSYNNVKSQISITADFSFEQFDNISAIEAIIQISTLFNIPVYHDNGVFFFYDTENRNNTKEIYEYSDLKITNKFPKYTHLSLEWEGGGSLIEVDGDINLGVTNNYIDATRNRNIVLTDSTNATATANRNILQNGYQKNIISFNSQKEFFINNYLYEINGIVFRVVKIEDKTVFGEVQYV